MLRSIAFVPKSGPASHSILRPGHVFGKLESFGESQQSDSGPPRHSPPSLPKWSLHDILFHITTIWLFTFSDIKTIIVPESLFGISHAVCVSVFHVGSKGLAASSSSSELWTTWPRVFLWVWINLLPFAISNQRTPESTAEDRVNKPWRPMPAGRMSPQTATRLMLLFYSFAFVVSLRLGGLSQHLLLVGLGFAYNDLGGADVSCITRNLINALGFLSFGTGAMDVALGGRMAWTSTLVWWQCLIAGIVFTSVHTQDMYDQEGDALRGRWTVPLSIGSVPARWIIAIATPCWTMVAACFWMLPTIFWLPSAVLAALIAYRTLTKHTVAQDKTTFKIWNLWLVTVYTLPLSKYLFAV